jgi:hypothetical protein
MDVHGLDLAVILGTSIHKQANMPSVIESAARRPTMEKWIVAVIGAGTLLLVFCRMKGGFGPYNLRAFGITLVATFATLLALRSETTLSAAMGILGAIAGYLFSIKSDKGDKTPDTNSTGGTSS